MTRRDAIKFLGATLAVAGLGLERAVATEAPSKAGAWELPDLGYAYGALEPHFDTRTMEIHHSKHHAAYLHNARNLLNNHPDLLAAGPEGVLRNLAAVPEGIRTAVRNNVGGHANHALFWRLLSPDPRGLDANGALARSITAQYGADLEGLRAQFSDAAMKRFGSGWAWLSAKPDGALVVHSTANQDSPLSEGLNPVIGLDVWEHAYYLHFQNRRADYVTAFWRVLDWRQAEDNFAAGLRA